MLSCGLTIAAYSLYVSNVNLDWFLPSYIKWVEYCRKPDASKLVFELHSDCEYVCFINSWVALLYQCSLCNIVLTFLEYLPAFGKYKSAATDPKVNVKAQLTHIRDDEDYYATDLLSCWGYQGNCNFIQESLKQLTFMESKGIWSNKVDPTEALKTPSPLGWLPHGLREDSYGWSLPTLPPPTSSSRFNSKWLGPSPRM